MAIACGQAGIGALAGLFEPAQGLDLGAEGAEGQFQGAGADRLEALDD
jgi:hypothetical protein